MAPLLVLLGPLRRRGANIPKEGGVLVVANHLSDFDPIVVQYHCRRPVFFLAKSELFEMGKLGKVIRWFGCIPVKRGEADRAALRHAIDRLKAGQVVVIFPEGQLSSSGELQELKSGFALIVRAAGVPVVVCKLTGTNRIIPYGKVTPRPALGGVSSQWSEPNFFNEKASTEEIVSKIEACLRA